MLKQLYRKYVLPFDLEQKRRIAARERVLNFDCPEYQAFVAKQRQSRSDELHELRSGRTRAVACFFLEYSPPPHPTHCCRFFHMQILETRPLLPSFVVWKQRMGAVLQSIRSSGRHNDQKRQPRRPQKRTKSEELLKWCQSSGTMVWSANLNARPTRRLPSDPLHQSYMATCTQNHPLVKGERVNLLLQPGDSPGWRSRPASAPPHPDLSRPNPARVCNPGRIMPGCLRRRQITARLGSCSLAARRRFPAVLRSRQITAGLGSFPLAGRA